MEYNFPKYQHENVTIYNGDNMELLAATPDKYYDISIIDPPYGIGATVTIGSGDKRSGRKSQNKWGNKEWDKKRPSIDFFNELIRVSKNQIIFGGNYFSDLLPPSRCWIVWDKVQRIDQADAELAYTSFNTSVRVFQYNCSNLQGFMNPNRFHPTEKAVQLYDWIYSKYVKDGDKVLDSHLGSGSNAIAAYKNKDKSIKFTGIEIDKDYFYASVKRFKEYSSQKTIFDL